MPAPLALTGQRFGHLTALDRAGKDQFHDWADEIGVKPNTLVYRLRRGWTLDRALDIANMEVPDEA